MRIHQRAQPEARKRELSAHHCRGDRGAVEEQHIEADPDRAQTVGLGWLKEEQLA